MPSAIIHVWDVVNNDNKMKKSELRQIIRKVLREEKVGDKKSSSENILCKVGCFVYIPTRYLGYQKCVNACNAYMGGR